MWPTLFAFNYTVIPQVEPTKKATTGKGHRRERKRKREERGTMAGRGGCTEGERKEGREGERERDSSITIANDYIDRIGNLISNR